MKTNQAISNAETTPPAISDLRTKHRDLDREITRLQKLEANPRCRLSPENAYKLDQLRKQRLAIRDRLASLGAEKDPSPQERRNAFQLVQ